MSDIALQHLRGEKYAHVALGLLMLFLGLAGALWLHDASHLLKILYPGVVFGVGSWLYATRPPLYLGFLWWVWLTTPFVRRLVELQTGFDELNLIMTAPLAVTLPVLVSPFRFGRHLTRREFFPYLLLVSGIIYGYLVGLPKTSVFGATLTLLSWLLPVALAFHLHVLWRQYRPHRSALRAVFRWGVLLLGIYGVLQYVYPAPWDQAWMTASGMTSIGQPEPFEVRVFSMLNAPGPFAAVMMAGLVVLFADASLVSRLALAPGFVAFLLALVRSTWGGWIAAMGYMAFRTHGAMRSRLVKGILVGSILVAPFLFYGPIVSEVNDRLDTITALRDDTSFNDRVQFFRVAAGWVLSNPVGAGLGGTGRGAKVTGQGIVSFDSGLLSIPYTLGWPGALLYLSGFVLLLRPLLQIRSNTTDLFAVACVSIVVAMTVQLLFSNSLTDLKGMVAWTFVGLGLAARLYYASSPDAD